MGLITAQYCRTAPILELEVVWSLMLISTRCCLHMACIRRITHLRIALESPHTWHQCTMITPALPSHFHAVTPFHLTLVKHWLMRIAILLTLILHPSHAVTLWVIQRYQHPPHHSLAAATTNRITNSSDMHLGKGIKQCAPEKWCERKWILNWTLILVCQVWLN